MMNSKLCLIVAILASAVAFGEAGEGNNVGPSAGARFASDAYPGFDDDDKVINSEKKEPSLLSFIYGPKRDSASEQFAYCQELVKEESWKKAVGELDALVREWPSAPEAAPAQEMLAGIWLEHLDDAEEAFREYRYLVDFYSLSCDYSRIVDKLYEIAGKMRLDGKTIVFFRFKNSVDVRRAYESCVLRAPGASWAPQAMLTIAEIREEDDRYTEAVKVYENLRNIHHGAPEAKIAIVRESLARMKLLEDYGYNRERTIDTVSFLKLAQTLCNEADSETINECLKKAESHLEESAWKSLKFYDSKMRTRRSAINAYEHYLKEFPEGEHAEAAKLRIQELKEGETK